MGDLINLGLMFLVVVFAYVFGTLMEEEHYAHIKKGEKDFVTLPAVTSKNIENIDQIQEVQLVHGSVVISLDYFKRILAGLRNVFGGRIKSYETLLDRGRREAILRMKGQARKWGADMILNMRFETSSIGMVAKGNSTIGCFEVFAYGTAIKLKKD